MEYIVIARKVGFTLKARTDTKIEALALRETLELDKYSVNVYHGAALITDTLYNRKVG